MSVIRHPLPSPRRIQTRSFESIEYMKGGLNTKTSMVGEQFIESSEDIYDMPDEEQASAVATVNEDITNDYLHPIYNQDVHMKSCLLKSEAVKRKERIRRWNLDRTAKQQLLTVGGSCSSTKNISGENTKIGNETRKQEPSYKAITVGGIILVLSVVVLCICMLLSSTTEETENEPTCYSISMAEINSIKQRVQRQDLKIEDLTYQLQKKTNLLKNLSNKIDRLELYMKTCIRDALPRDY